jgi:hypothetical protein
MELYVGAIGKTLIYQGYENACWQACAGAAALAADRKVGGA